MSKRLNILSEIFHRLLSAHFGSEVPMKSYSAGAWGMVQERQLSQTDFASAYIYAANLEVKLVLKFQMSILSYTLQRSVDNIVHRQILRPVLLRLERE